MHDEVRIDGFWGPYIVIPGVHVLGGEYKVAFADDEILNDYINTPSKKTGDLIVICLNFKLGVKMSFCIGVFSYSLI